MIRWFERHNKLSLAITIIIGIFIFCISSLQFTGQGGGGGSGLKAIVYHLLIFFLFAGFLFVSIIKGKKIKNKTKKLFFLGFAIALVYAILDELHQFFVIGRNCALSDVFLNSVGIVFALVIYLIILELRG